MLPPCPRAPRSRRAGPRSSSATAVRIKVWLDDLLTLLAPLERAGLVRAWSDEEIEPGQVWRKEIGAALAAASVGVFLVSRHSLASRFIMDEELPHFLDAAAGGRATILWALLSEALYEATPFQDIQALHDVRQPLYTLSKAGRARL
jgi:hypothetical protein